MKVMYNGRVLKNVRKDFKCIKERLPDLVEYLETTRVHPIEEKKFNDALLRYKFSAWVESLEKKDRHLFDFLSGKEAESYFDTEDRQGVKCHRVICTDGTRVNIMNPFKGVKTAGTLYV